MKLLLTTSLFLVMANCFSQVSSLDINLINGKWELPIDIPLTGSADSDISIEDIQGYHEFTIDCKTGIGQTLANYGFAGSMRLEVRVFDENEKSYIEIKNKTINMKGLITVLTEKEFAFIVNDEYTRVYKRK